MHIHNNNNARTLLVISVIRLQKDAVPLHSTVMTHLSSRSPRPSSPCLSISVPVSLTVLRISNIAQSLKGPIFTSCTLKWNQIRWYIIPMAEYSFCNVDILKKDLGKLLNHRHVTAFSFLFFLFISHCSDCTAEESIQITNR